MTPLARVIATLAVIVTAIGIGSSAQAGVDGRPSPRNPDVVFTGINFRPPIQGDKGTDRWTSRPYTPPPNFSVCPVRPEIGNYGCRTDQPDDDEAELTEGDVLRAVREIGLPRLEVSIQPGERTLVNARTIFSTEPVPFARSVTLVGFDVDLEATPSSFTWHHGDGTSARTTEAGRPYPAFDVTHRYRAPADVVKPRVDVSYRVRYRVDGGAWSTIGQTITAAGPAGELEVREAAPVLTAP